MSLPIKKFLLFAVILTVSCTKRPEVFDLFDSDNPQIQVCKTEADILNYYRSRDNWSLLSYFDTSWTPKRMKIASEALEHKFYVMEAYQPSYYYGEDIDWQYWPVRDNELRWQLHRQPWFKDMAAAYLKTGEEKFAEEFVLQYRDWIKKNPNGGPAWQQPGGVVSAGEIALDAPNWEFAWRPLEVSSRLDRHPFEFAAFLNSPHFTPEFLSEFLKNYHDHMVFLSANLAPEGNHRIYEAASLLYGSLFFPEFKDSPEIKAFAIKVLEEEANKQIYSDGVQMELDPSYHIGMIGTYAGVLPHCGPRLREILHKMVKFITDISFPDYTYPCFGDCRLHGKDSYLANLRKWSALFPEDSSLRWWATEGREGSQPSYLSSAFPESGFYVFRTGWDKDATVMVIKAGKEGAWHAQPDFGTFEIWSKGKNLFPDSGSYVYAGDEQVMKQRNWFRQTRVHNTVSMDGKNAASAACKQLFWDGNELEYEHQSYPGVNHRRKFIFNGGRDIRIEDTMTGEGAGMVNVNYALAPVKASSRLIGRNKAEIVTKYMTISISSDRPGKLRSQEGWYSPEYREKYERPSFSYDIEKQASDTLKVSSAITIGNR